MKLIKKFVLITGIFLCFMAIILAGTGIYLYYHPERIKPTIERSLSATTGSACTIESISFSLQPMGLEARGILFKTLDASMEASSLEIPFIRTDMTIEGPWSRRSLILKNMAVNGIFINGAWAAIFPGKTGSSFLAVMIQGVVSLIFFKDIRFESGEIHGGHILASWGDQNIKAHQIHAQAGIDKPLFVSFTLEVENSFRNLHVTAPNVTLISNNAFDITDFKFNGTLQAQDITIQDAGVEIQSMDVQSSFTYSQDHKNLNAQNFQIRINGLALMGKTNGRIPPLDVNLQAKEISSQYPVIEITNATLQIPRAKVHAKDKDILIGDIGIHIPDGRMDMEKKSIALPNLRCDVLGLKNMVLDIDIKSDMKNDSANLVLQGAGTALFQAAAAYQLIPPDVIISAADAIRIEAAGPTAGPWHIKANLSLEDLAFQNKDGSLMGEKISLTTRSQGVVDLKDSTISFDAVLEVKSGEALYDRYYVNLAKNPVVSSCSGVYRVDQKFLRLSAMTLNLTDILPLEITGSIQQGPAGNSQWMQNADFTATIPQVPVKPIFYHLVQEPYKFEKPLLASLETGGTVSAQLRLEIIENNRRIAGRLEWRDGHLALKDAEKYKKISVAGIQLDLPVWYKTGLSETPGENLMGRLEIQSLMFPPLPDQAFSILLDAGPNRISVDSPTIIRVPGGEIRLGAVQAQNIYDPDISVNTSITIDGIDMRTLLSGIGVFPPDAAPKGSLSGILDPVRYEKYAVVSQGTITARIFGGTLLLSDLGASGILTAAPVFKLNAHWDDLLLASMTTDTAFGKIEGVLTGHIRDFEIAYGQPQRFDLLMETVERKGTPQTISITAVDNIARIGGGQSPFMGLAGAFASVFEKFPYEKIGIRAGLENDMFTINGTIMDNGEEYIVKRQGFSGVNIINQNPDNRINFKDMVKRIQRIAHKGGAVIN
ncbi:MAG: hypothetical protein C4548_00340 [Desulfobacteraceae bacterium]|jgi:hypothetical protein|nr:MAG: hypothetical protein C4548_00340 [Desulfobacteraceae bacterium]